MGIRETSTGEIQTSKNKGVEQLVLLGPPYVTPEFRAKGVGRKNMFGGELAGVNFGGDSPVG